MCRGQDTKRVLPWRSAKTGILLSTMPMVLLVAGCGKQSHEDEFFSPPPDRQHRQVATPSEGKLSSTKLPTETANIVSHTAAHKKMLDALKEIQERSVDENRYVGDGHARQLRTTAKQLPPDEPASKQWKLFFQLGKAELVLGNERAAIQALKRCFQLNDRLHGVLPREASNNLLFELGLAYLRLGETQNCCRRNTPESCILPIQGGGLHTNREGSENAIKYFTELARRTKRLSLNHLKARWLLNIAYMTLGRYPGDVPDSFLIPPTVLESEEPFPRFANIASRVGLDTLSQCGGAVVDDFDADGYLDIAVSSFEPWGQLRLFMNNADGTFRDHTHASGLLGIFGGLNMIQADYNNDGHVDLLVLRGAWLFEFGQHPNSLLRNNGNGTFTDVTFDAGLGEVHYPTQTAAWADYDNDGDLDLYIGNETTSKLKAPCQLFRNNGNETFTDVAIDADVTNDRFTKAVVWGDYDNDRLPDLYVSNLHGTNRLYRNSGDGTFQDVAPQLNVELPRISFPAWFWDYDNNGYLDLYVTAYNSSIANLAADHLEIKSEAEMAHLYRGNGKSFEEVSSEVGLTQSNFPMGCNFGDLENDGYLDFYLGTGDIRYEAIAPNVMYRNQEGNRFVNVTMAGGFGHLQKGHAVVFADLDNDGDQDIFEQLGGAFLGDKFHDALFENPGFGNHWISIELEGIETNRSAIGARIHLEIKENGQVRSIYKHVNSGGSFGANPLRQTIGVGKAERIQHIEIFWPTTGKTQVLKNIQVDRCLRIVEGRNDFTTIQLRQFHLRGQAPDEE